MLWANKIACHIESISYAAHFEALKIACHIEAFLMLHIYFVAVLSRLLCTNDVRVQIKLLDDCRRLHVRLCAQK